MERITSKNNKIIKLVSFLMTSAKERKNSDLFVAEGLRICCDAYLSNIAVKYLLLTEAAFDKKNELIEKIADSAEKVYILSEEIFKRISETKSPQGIIAVCSTENLPVLEPVNTKKYIAAENISDPSNLGTIVRTAEALGIGGLILSKNSCDLYSPKLVRGSMGGVFRLPTVIPLNFTEYLQGLRKQGFKIISSVVNKDAKALTDLKTPPGTIVVIGNEANGVTDETLNISDELLTIPMLGKAESLNAAMAAGIIMWELMK